MLVVAIAAAGWGVLASAQQIVRHETHQATVGLSPRVEPIYYPLSPKRDVETILAQGEVPEDILHAFLEDHSAMRYHLAAESAQRLVEIAPDVPLSHYNQACVMARLRRLTDSFVALHRAVDTGWRDTRHLHLDPDLAELREDRRFPEVIDRIHHLTNVEQPDPEPLRDDDYTAIVTDLESQTELLLQASRVPGAVIGLVRDGEVVWVRAFGERITDEAMTESAQFRVPRATDALVLCAAMQEDASGRIDLDRLLRLGLETHLAALAPRPERHARRRSGIVPAGRDVSVAGHRHGARGTSRSAKTSRRTERPTFDSFDLLRSAVENAAQCPIEQYCREHLLRPLLMIDTRFKPATDPATRAIGHSMFGTPTSSTTTSRPDHRPIAHTTAGDLAQLMAELLSEPEGGAVTGLAAPQLSEIVALSERLPAETARAVGIDVLGRRRGLPQHGLGLDVALDHTADGPRLQVQETTGGTGCLLRMYTANRSGIVVLFNSETGMPFAERLARLALGGR